MKKLYKYVGDSEVLESTKDIPGGQIITCSKDVLEWIDKTKQKSEADGLYWATFIISDDESFYIADRRSEHVACAEGKPVLSAGEVAFCIDKNKSEIFEISNQSTGFCPEPESWLNIKDIFIKIGIPHPSDFTFKVIFRRCPKCGERNIVRDSYYVCACCESELTEKWNF